MLNFLRNLEWKYVAAESLIVAVGVAMALAADAWWEDRSDRRTENAYVEGLRDEFGVTSSDLDHERDAALESLAAIDELLDRISSRSVDVSLGLRNLLETAFQTSVLRPVTATYDDLVASGNMGLLEDDALRIALAEWQAHLEIHRRLEDHILAPHYVATDEFLVRNMTMTSEPAGGRESDDLFQFDESEFFSSRELWNRLQVRRTWIGNRQLSLDALRERLGRVQDLLRVE